MSERQDHEKIVSAARQDMARFDERQALERWLQNYVSPDRVIPVGQWCVVTKEAKGWKVDLGLADADEPYLTAYADAHAPAPPVMEIRPPKPEPVKPRFQVPYPHPVPGLDEMMADIQRGMQRKIMEAFALPADFLTATDAAQRKTLTALDIANMLQMIESANRVSRRAHAPDWLRMDYEPPHWRFASYGMMPIRSERIIAIGMDGGTEPPIKRPPPVSSVRNK
jgi:hypothetical protein